MAESIPDLWSEDIAVDVLTPIAILRAQVEPLRRRTKGILLAEVDSIEAGDQVQHDLDLIAPFLPYRHRILTAKHDRSLVYPVFVRAESLEIRGDASRPSGRNPEEPDELGALAASDEEFIKIVRNTLQSRRVRGLINSLIARSNEVRRDNGSAPPAHPGSDAGTDRDRSGSN